MHVNFCFLFKINFPWNDITISILYVENKGIQGRDKSDTVVTVLCQLAHSFLKYNYFKLIMNYTGSYHIHVIDMHSMVIFNQSK